MPKKLALFLGMTVLTLLAAREIEALAVAKKPVIVPSNQVLGNGVGAESSPERTFGKILSQSVTPSPSPLPTPTPKPLKLKNISLALLGDSMMQTMGEGVYLKKILEEANPGYQFRILNFGVGGTTIMSGWERLPEVIKENPDMVVVESFAYNHSALTLDQQWQTLIKIVDALKEKKIQVILLATLAPNSSIYAKGIEGINWSQEERQAEAKMTKSFLENIIGFARGSKLPLADAYSASLDQYGQGKTIYIEKATNLHPSEEGKRLVSQKITEVVTTLLRK